MIEKSMRVKALVIHSAKGHFRCVQGHRYVLHAIAPKIEEDGTFVGLFSSQANFCHECEVKGQRSSIHPELTMVETVVGTTVRVLHRVVE